MIGFLIIKQLGNHDDRETVEHIRENMYMQYSLGHSSFKTAQPFDSMPFVEFGDIPGTDNPNEINEKIIVPKTKLDTSKAKSKP